MSSTRPLQIALLFLFISTLFFAHTMAARPLSDATPNEVSNLVAAEEVSKSKAQEEESSLKCGADCRRDLADVDYIYHVNP